jgi:hypothetical protein
MASENKRVAEGMVVSENKPQGRITQWTEMVNECSIAELRTEEKILFVLYKSTSNLS